jgi:hypothetical protein
VESLRNQGNGEQAVAHPTGKPLIAPPMIASHVV